MHETNAFCFRCNLSFTNKLFYCFTFTDSIKKSEDDLNQSATVKRRSGCEYTNATIIATKIIFTMAVQIFFRIKAHL